MLFPDYYLTRPPIITLFSSSMGSVWLLVCVCFDSNRYYRWVCAYGFYGVYRSWQGRWLGEACNSGLSYLRSHWGYMMEHHLVLILLIHVNEDFGRSTQNCECLYLKYGVNLFTLHCMFPSCFYFYFVYKKNILKTKIKMHVFFMFLFIFRLSFFGCLSCTLWTNYWRKITIDCII